MATSVKGEGGMRQKSNTRSLPFLWPLTPESLHKQTPSSAINNRSRSDSSTPSWSITHSDSPGPSPASDTSYPYPEVEEVPMTTQEDKMIELTFHVRTFSEALICLPKHFYRMRSVSDFRMAEESTMSKQYSQKDHYRSSKGEPTAMTETNNNAFYELKTHNFKDQRLHTAVYEVVQWATANKLPLNENKTKVLIPLLKDQYRSSKEEPTAMMGTNALHEVKPHNFKKDQYRSSKEEPTAMMGTNALHEVKPHNFKDQRLHTAVYEVVQWATANKLPLNENKTKVLIPLLIHTFKGLKTVCNVCENNIWGFAKQGVKCLGDGEQALVLSSGVLEALQLQTCDPSDVVARLQESLPKEQASLEQPHPETKRRIRCLCMKAKSTNRLDVVEKLREMTPAGTTGPLLPEALDVRTIPFRQRQNVTFHLCGRDDWKLFAERLGLTPAEIGFLDKRVLNPCDAALAHSCKQGYITSVGDLYDALVDCDLPLIADLL
ncbi:hypothetical protein OS493_002193 [Desmophyllum pertusum]|uniref:Uncharacterized protein n=1 Tax=Desmophyllum pertusum TaxID=174260 RepID=A0A9W9Z7N6_9CNID|nr:hypothetical protein OS493_002193 [Desmophyllum pertusum]